MESAGALRALLMAFGERGDVEPFAVLARGLLAAGHRPLLVAPAGCAGLAQGVEFRGVGRRVLDECWAAARGGADVVVHNRQAFPAHHIAERLGCPAVLGQVGPGPAPAIGWAATRAVDRWRAAAGLPRRRGRHDPLRAPDGSPTPVLHAVSPQLVALPPGAVVTGHWFPEPGELPPALRAFLAAGPPPVHVDLPTTPTAVDTTAAVLAATRKAGVRAIIATGRPTPCTAASPDVFVIDTAPQTALFPYVAAVIHHGGTRTAAAAAAAGKPQVLHPITAEQHFWATRLHHLGLAPPAQHPRTSRVRLRLAPSGCGAGIQAGQRPWASRIGLAAPGLDPDHLAAAITAALGLASRAAEVGARMRAEDGVAGAVAWLERAVPWSRGVGPGHRSADH